MNETEILARLGDQRVFRDSKIELERASKDDRRVDLAFSSEAPVERWFGFEILGHKTGEMDDSWLKSRRAPVLFNHDLNKVVGIVESVRVGSDRVGRATVRLGKGELADGVFRDLDDGILVNVSVGYRINEFELESEADGVKAYRATKWQPLEISIVAVPADMTVGVGRSNLSKETIMENEIQPGVPERRPDPIVSDASERHRSAEIMALGRRFNQIAAAANAIQNGTPIETFRGMVLNSLPAATPIDVSLGVGMPALHLEKHQYSLSRAVSRLLDRDGEPAGLEREVSQELSLRSGKSPQGFYVPYDVIMGRATMTAGGATTGAELVGTTLRPDQHVDPLYIQPMVKALGAQVLSGLVGNVAIPKISAGTTAQWVAENNAASESNLTTALLSLTPHTLTAHTVQSRRLILQGLPAIEQLVRDDLAMQLAIGIDAAAINGSGTNNQPTGILNTSGIGAVSDAATNGGAPTWEKISALIKEVSIDNAYVSLCAFLGKS